MLHNMKYKLCTFSKSRENHSSLSLYTDVVDEEREGETEESM